MVSAKQEKQDQQDNGGGRLEESDAEQVLILKHVAPLPRSSAVVSGGSTAADSCVNSEKILREKPCGDANTLFSD
jgi:hypothetical protein